MIDNMHDRQENINEIINLGVHNPHLNNYYLAALFVELGSEIMVYERIGVDLIGPRMQAIINNSEPMAAVLTSYIDPETETTTVQQAINGYING